MAVESSYNMFKDDTIHNKKYRAWVRAGLALKYLKEGITDALDDSCRKQHAAFISDIYKQQGAKTFGCDKCSLNTLLPLHCTNKKGQCPQAKRQKCNCILENGRKPCPTNFCSSMYDAITKCHRFASPNWKNTNIHEWHNNYWEIAKCYISADGYKHVLNPATTDLSALLCILVNNMDLQNAFDLPLNEIVPKIRKFRNETLHSTSMELNEYELKENISYMTDILGDKKQMTSRTDAQNALRKLIALKNDDIIITMENEAGVCRAAMTALEEKERKLHDSLQTPWEISNSGDNVVQDKINTDYMERKKELQTSLITLYRRRYFNTPIIPSLFEHDNGASAWYVQPEMVVEYPETEKEDKRKVVKFFRDIFYTNEKRNKTIYILGDAGVGKTTFSKRMIYRWCKIHDDQCANGNLGNNDDDLILSEFDFLFFIPLCHVQGTRHVHDMIKDELLHGSDNKLLNKMLDTHSEKCLIILDGLDEWTPDNGSMHNRWRQMQNETIPQVGTLQNYTVLTTTRPWKMDEIRLNTFERGVHIRMTGLSDESVSIFIESMVSSLNIQSTHDRHSSEFKKMISCSHLASLQQIPILLVQLICLWYDDKHFRNSVCEIYSNIVEVMLKMATEKRMPLKQSPAPKPQIQRLPACFGRTVCCQEYKGMLHKLGAIALHTLCYEHVNASTKQFSKREMLKMLTPEEVYWCLATGVLTETRSNVESSLTHARSDMSFIHKSFQEFFAAIYISTEKDFQTAREQVPVCNQVRCISDMKTFFVFVSGMNPFLGLYLLEELQDGTHCTCSKHDEKLQNLKIACHHEIEATRPL
ncbi:uncharacterized protein LOC123551184 [Mercenaria mercenaria]|uniref:uncharacterized protein LOC123551184 n=1 Tax=Mercenaria mercenaria TaxID=6596 RepID=UPI00234F29B8|nr:uncharacterized protein LOC123551184 [Mercenaria mercenaria]